MREKVRNNGGIDKRQKGEVEKEGNNSKLGQDDSWVRFGKGSLA